MKNLRLPRSPKVLLGLSIVGFFIIMTVIGPFLAPYDPSSTAFAPLLTP